MDIKNCVKCMKLFNYVSGPSICASCRKSIEDQFKEVRLYIRKNPKATIPEVGETCNVDTKQIRQWIREERLSFSEDSAIGIECEMCGKTIRTGRYCDGCKTQIANNLDSAYKKTEVKEDNPYDSKDTSSKMRFLNKDNM
ncbi:MAG: flagellar protein [Firmicutes bacterium HGW-Firmicutes-7]|nr:MAG: flagellar protein [Firmicutes bacterium HGW-Firmicutes-7]